MKTLYWARTNQRTLHRTTADGPVWGKALCGHSVRSSTRSCSGRPPAHRKVCQRCEDIAFGRATK